MSEQEKMTEITDDDMNKVMGGTKTIRYTVRPGDTVDSIAQAYGVPAESIMLWNRFDRSCTLPRSIVIYK